MNTNTIEVDHFYMHPRAKIWKALTDPALVAKWWAPGDIKAQDGHKFTMDMGTFGKQDCAVTKVILEKILQYKFGTGSINTLITWTLSEQPEGTHVNLKHEGFKLDSPMGKQAKEGMAKGWPMILARMESVLT